MAIPTKYSSASHDMKETNDCAVIAVAVACKVSYKEAHAACRRAGRKARRGMFLHQIKTAINILGHDFESVEEWKGKTTKTITVPREDNYLAVTSNHAIGIHFGLVKDYSDRKNMRIKSLYKITER